ncbi:MAG TPA: hypothetical protein PKY96_02860 [Flavobacteriales bacterium]|nr:hypothetical protein [Flavobacteriales bacterium]
MSIESEPEGCSDEREQFRAAIAGATLTPAARNRKLVFWTVRQTILCAIAWFFWQEPWMPWVFWIGLCLAAVNLAMILLMPSFLSAQRKRGEAALNRLEALKDEPARDSE